MTGPQLCGGCATARVEEPLTATYGGNEIDDQFEFWHQLAQRPLTSNDEAFHGLLLYALDADPADNYHARVAALKSRGWLPARFDRPAHAVARRGELAVAIAQILRIRGGLMMRLTRGRHPRYALLELEEEGIYPASSENQTFSGSEFLGIIGRMEDYRRGNQTDLPAAVLEPARTAGSEAPRPAAPQVQQTPAN
ncbi:MAG TPA: hypothetical protein VGR35_20990 [Tepidisphaeraceae bacterium]|nr:hypothetical protein [Tepidisphaeraceae bacterium]